MSIMRRHAKVECPRCKQIWDVPWAADGVECTCHKWCSDGDKEADCTWAIYNYSGGLGWPVGAHVNAENEGDDVLHRVGYCSAHNKYTYKVPMWIQVDWSKWKDPKWRAPRKFRDAIVKG